MRLARAQDADQGQDGCVMHDVRGLGVIRRQSKAMLSKTPEWCYRHEHPLRVGSPGKLYMRYDFVSPIMDSMSRSYERIGGQNEDAFGVFLPPRKRRKVEAAAAEKTAKARPVGSVTIWTCKGCGSTDEHSLLVQNEATCCPCGVVVFMGSMVRTHREKLGAAADEDKTQHADALYSKSSDKYDRSAPTNEERHAERRLSGKASNLPGKRLKGFKRMCDAQAHIEKKAANEQLAAAIENGTAVEFTESGKFAKILAQLDSIFRQLAPVDHSVRRNTRIVMDNLWIAAVRHCRGCERQNCCELRLVERSPNIIASAVFHHALEGMLHGTVDDSGTTREHLLDLQVRTQRATTNPSKLTQIGTAKAMINIFTAVGFDPDVNCAPPPAQDVSIPPARSTVAMRSKSAAMSPQLSIHTSFARTDSSMSCDGTGSPAASDVVELRDAVSRMFVAHTPDLPIAVRSGTFRAIQAPTFLDTCKSMELLRDRSLSSIAFCVLNAVWREQQADEATRSTSFNDHGLSCPLNVFVATKLELDLAVAEQAIEKIRAIVPMDATSEASVRDDDDMFT